MASWISKRHGKWSRASNNADSPWHDGGAQTALASVPGALAKDTVTIDVGHIVTYDYDNSAGFGYGDIAIGTGAYLMASQTAGDYVLKMSGTSGDDITGAGTIMAGSSLGNYPTTCTFTIALGTASKILGTSGLVVDFHCSEPPHTYVKLSEDEAAGQTVLSIDTDLTGETDYWVAGKYLAISNVNQESDYQGPGTANARTITSVSADPNTLEISDVLDSDNVEGAYIFLVWRNIDITSTGSQYVFDSCSNSHFGCSVRHNSTSLVGRGINTGTNNTMSGIIAGFQHGVSTVFATTISGIVAGTLYGVSSGGCNLISGVITSCARGIYSTSENVITGTISGCQYAINSGASNSISGTITGNTYGNYQSSGLYLQCSSYNNGTDIYNDNLFTLIEGYGSRLDSTTTVNIWKNASFNTLNYNVGIFLYDYADTSGLPRPGYVKCWMPGGRVWTEAAATVEAVTTTVPVAGEYYHHVYAEDDTAPVFLDTPIFVKKNRATVYKCWYYDVDGNWNTLPQFQIIDPDYSFNNASAILAYDTAANTQSAWQELTIRYVSAYDRQLILRFIGVGNSTSETRNSYFRFFNHQHLVNNPTDRGIQK